jgi:CDP-diacylglycerol--glycerol-3-phosphate 3-phosphatidyltransferase
LLKKEANKVWTIPNVLSFIRLLLIAPAGILLWNGENVWAATLALIAGLLDITDGIIARKYNQTSELGKIIDPLADKLFIAVLVIVLFLQNRLPLWFILAVISRDLLILIGGAVISTKIKIVPPSNWLGKITALTVGITILSIIVNLRDIYTILMYLSVVLIVASFVNYVISVQKQIKGIEIVNK